MNVMISWVLVVLISVAGISIVMIVGLPMISQAQSAAALNEAESVLQQLDGASKTVSREGIGSSRIIDIPNIQQGTWKLVPEENLIEFAMPSSPLEPLVRRIKSNIAYVSGFDATCSASSYGGNTDAWLLENSHLKVYLQRVNGTIDTEKNILAMESKVTGAVIIPVDASIEIDGNSATSAGTGFSEMRTGENMPSCRARFFVNTTGASYDVFYTLYSGADFIVAEVRNIA